MNVHRISAATLSSTGSPQTLFGADRVSRRCFLFRLGQIHLALGRTVFLTSDDASAWSALGLSPAALVINETTESSELLEAGSRRRATWLIDLQDDHRPSPWLKQQLAVAGDATTGLRRFAQAQWGSPLGKLLAEDSHWVMFLREPSGIPPMQTNQTPAEQRWLGRLRDLERLERQRTERPRGGPQRLEVFADQTPEYSFDPARALDLASLRLDADCIEMLGAVCEPGSDLTGFWAFALDPHDDPAADVSRSEHVRGLAS